LPETEEGNKAERFVSVFTNSIRQTGGRNSCLKAIFTDSDPVQGLLLLIISAGQNFNDSVKVLPLGCHALYSLTHTGVQGIFLVSHSLVTLIHEWE